MAKTSTHKFKWKFFVAGLLAITIGYVMLATSDITIAPMLLVLGYCILIPVSFL